MPKISIIIPTKARPHAAAEALKHCLSQTFTNFEVVVVDNNTDDATKNIVKSFQDERIRLVRTGNLSMADNWDTGLAHAQGEYVYLIGDRLLLFEDALAKINDGFTQHKTEFLCFRCPDMLTQEEEPFQPWEKIPTSHAINKIEQGLFAEYYKYGPRGYSLVASNRLLSNMRKRYSRVCTLMCPDFILGFMCMLHTEYFTTSTTPLFAFNQNTAGNGASGYFEGTLIHTFLIESGVSLADAVKYSPIPVATVANAVISDFFRVCKLIGYNADSSKINIVQLWKTLFDEILSISSRLHVDKSKDFQTLLEFAHSHNFYATQEIQKFIDQRATPQWKDIVSLKNSHTEYPSLKREIERLSGLEVYFWGCGELYSLKKDLFKHTNPRCILIDSNENNTPEKIDGIPVFHPQNILVNGDILPIVIFSQDINAIYRTIFQKYSCYRDLIFVAQYSRP